MTECLDEIIDLRDDDSDTLETLESSDEEEDLDRLEDLHVDVEISHDQVDERKPLTKTEVEVETIRGRLARVLETSELEQRSRQAEADCLQQASLPPCLDLLKHHLIEEFETVCKTEKALVFLLCGQTKQFLKNL